MLSRNFSLQSIPSLEFLVINPSLFKKVEKQGGVGGFDRICSKSWKNKGGFRQGTRVMLKEQLSVTEKVVSGSERFWMWSTYSPRMEREHGNASNFAVSQPILKTKTAPESYGMAPEDLLVRILLQCVNRLLQWVISLVTSPVCIRFQTSR